MLSERIISIPCMANFSEIDTKQLRIMAIEGITGLKNINSAFDNQLNETEIELLISFLNRKYFFSECEDVFNFIVNVIKISTNALNLIGANYKEFYDNMSIEEALDVILKKLLITIPDVPTFNKFPAEFNFNISQKNTIQTYDGQKWYPYTKGKDNINYGKLLDKLMADIKLKKGDNIYFHGTSFHGAISIMNGIVIRPRQNCTDFGLRNFYLTDTFETACIWASRNQQSAVVIFVISDDYINSLENHLSLRNIDEWKNTVFKIRNEPKSGYNYKNDIKNYRNFIKEIDSHDLISGPILANIHASDIDNLKYIKYDTYIPYQYSFKDTTIDDLNRMLAITLFFESSI